MLGLEAEHAAGHHGCKKMIDKCFQSVYDYKGVSRS